MEESRSSRFRIYIEVCVVVLYFFIPLNVSEPVPKLSKVRGGTPMHKVILTQRGYIQFLRWELAVPDIKEFTFCLWMISNNLTLPHSIFSYSKNERDRLVRSWISAQGRSIHLEIGGNEVFQARTKIVENRWYHVCESWENLDGRYALWIDGRIESQGYDGKTKGHIVPRGGDIVLGQEYTDFDKGLEEGIEGAVLGFNFLLASAFPPLDWNYGNDLNPRISDSTLYNKETPLEVLLQKNTRLRSTILKFPEVILQKYRFGNEGSRKRSIPAGLVFDEASANTTAVKRQSGISDKGNISYENRRIDFGIEKPRKRDLRASTTQQDPLGLQLIKLSYVRCEIGRGSPFIGGPLMLISWTRTPVRIFGGAIVKNVRSDCGHFS